jgi:hypothetical protein
MRDFSSFFGSGPEAPAYETASIESRNLPPKSGAYGNRVALIVPFAA